MTGVILLESDAILFWLGGDISDWQLSSNCLTNGSLGRLAGIQLKFLVACRLTVWRAKLKLVIQLSETSKRSNQLSGSSRLHRNWHRSVDYSTLKITLHNITVSESGEVSSDAQGLTETTLVVLAIPVCCEKPFSIISPVVSWALTKSQVCRET